MEDPSVMYDYAILLMKVLWDYKDSTDYTIELKNGYFVCVCLCSDSYWFADWCWFLQGQGVKRNYTRGFQLLERAAAMVRVHTPSNQSVCQYLPSLYQHLYPCFRVQLTPWMVWAGTTGLYWKTIKTLWNTLNKLLWMGVTMPCLTWEFITWVGTTRTCRGGTRFEPCTFVLSLIRCDQWADIFSTWPTDGCVPAVSKCISAGSRSCISGSSLVPFDGKPGRGVSGCGEGCDVRGFH